MGGPHGRQGPAREPEDLDRLFLERARCRDVEGIVALYQPDAVLATPDGTVLTGRQAIRGFYARLLRDSPAWTGEVRPALRAGELALTVTRFNGGATAGVARRQSDGAWLWVIDQPNVLRWGARPCGTLSAGG